MQRAVSITSLDCVRIYYQLHAEHNTRFMRNKMLMFVCYELWTCECNKNYFNQIAITLWKLVIGITKQIHKAYSVKTITIADYKFQYTYTTLYSYLNFIGLSYRVNYIIDLTARTY